MQTKMVKICGITNQTDLDYCLTLQADFTGFVLHPQSPRCADIQFVAKVNPQINSAIPVIVFGFDSYEYIYECAKLTLTKQTMIQLPAGSQALESVISEFGINKIIPVVHISDYTEKIYQASLEKFSYVILDSAVVISGKILAGGTGKQIPYEHVKSFGRPFILAGGLSPVNICEAMRETGAMGADVASGTEQSPGIKDHQKVKSFIEKVKQPEIFCI